MLDEPDLVRSIAARGRGTGGRAAVGSAWLVGLLYLASFALPVDDHGMGYGYFLSGGFITLLLLPAAPFILLGGLLGDPTGSVGAKDLGLYLPWLANPALWAGLWSLGRGRPRRAAAAGAVALPLSLAFLLTEPTDLRAGYFAWVGSMALLLLAGLAVERAGPVRRLPDAGPKFAARPPAPDQGQHVRLPADSLRPSA
jgi:hypothetical protein